MIKYIENFPNVLVKKATANIIKNIKINKFIPLFYSSPFTYHFNNVLKLY
ncbi:hypothetical protein ACUXAH_000237 [Staphylococcus cohnii]